MVRAVPFHLTTEPATKSLPVAVRVKAAPPVDAEVGERLVRVGTGLLVAPVTLKVAAAVVPPPGAGVKTVTETVPAMAMSDAGTAAVSFPAET